MKQIQSYIMLCTLALFMSVSTSTAYPLASMQLVKDGKMEPFTILDWVGANKRIVSLRIGGYDKETQIVYAWTPEWELKKTSLSRFSHESQNIICAFQKYWENKGGKFSLLFEDWVHAEQLEEWEDIARTAIKRGHLDVTFKVLQSLDDGSLCELSSGKRNNRHQFDGELFFLEGIGRGTVADDHIITGHLLWIGTRTYTTTNKDRKTVNWYYFNNLYKAAKYAYGLAHKEDSDDTEKSSRTGTFFGSGFFITKTGYLLTNYHVIEDADDIVVYVAAEMYKAKLIDSDAQTDLALLKIEGKFSPLAFVNTRTARLGQTVFTVGFPQPDTQGLSPKVTRGIISSLKGLQDSSQQYQIDASIQPGNSGGPLLDEQGYVVGVNAASLNASYMYYKNGNIPQNVNYAIKKTCIDAFLEDHPEVLKELRTITQPPATNFEAAVATAVKSTVLIICTAREK